MNSGRALSLSRLRGRSWHEWRTRGTQVAAAALERLGWLDAAEADAVALHAMLGDEARRREPSTATWIARQRARGGHHFMPAFHELRQAAAHARAHDPDGVARIMDRAARALDGQLELLGLGPVPVGTPIDWHRDPIAGIVAPRVHWSRVPYLDPAVAGDHKRTWEVNRHQWLVTLAQAWVLTGDPRYSHAVDEALVAWMDANPPKIGINWASSLEVAFRAISWIWTLRLLGEAPELRDATVQRATAHLVLSARHLERNLSTWFSPNTHLTGEALALYHIGVDLSELSDAPRWKATGRRVLLECLPRHVRPDGTYFEQSTWYQRYTLDFYAHFAVLAAQEGDDLPEVREAVGRLGRVLAQVMRPDGSFPLIGDDDGGRLLFLDGRPGTDLRPALAIAGAVAGDNWLLRRAGDALGDAVWLLGDVPRVPPVDDPFPASVLYPDGGLAVIRGGWGEEATVMTIDCGPHGALNCGHAHADALSFDLTLRGRPLFVDPGTCSYTTDQATRDRFRSTEAHNAATFGGRSSSEMAGPFAWASQASTVVDGWESHDWGAAIDGHHDGFAPASTYRRSLIGFPDDGWFVVCDAWKAEVAGVAAVHLQGAIGTALEVTGRAVQVMREGVVAGVVFAPQGTLSVEGGAVSPAYGVSVGAPRLRIEDFGRGTITLPTVIAATGVVAGVRWVHGDSGRCLEVTHPDGRGATLVGFGSFQSLRMQLDIDATLWWLQLNEHGVPGASWAARTLGHRASSLVER